MDKLAHDQQALMEQYGLYTDASDDDLVKMIESIETGKEFASHVPWDSSKPKDSLVKQEMKTKGTLAASRDEEQYDYDSANVNVQLRPQRHDEQRNQRVTPVGAFPVRGSGRSTTGTVTGGSTISSGLPPEVTAELVTGASIDADRLREQIRRDVLDQVHREMERNVVNAELQQADQDTEGLGRTRDENTGERVAQSGEEKRGLSRKTWICIVGAVFVVVAAAAAATTGAMVTARTKAEEEQPPVGAAGTTDTQPPTVASDSPTPILQPPSPPSSLLLHQHESQLPFLPNLNH